MTTYTARVSKVQKTLAIAQAGILMLGLLSMSMPLTASAHYVPHTWEHQDDNDHPIHHERDDGSQGTLIVNKVIVGNPDANASDFSFTISNGSDTSGVHHFTGSGSTGTASVELDKGSYTVTETNPGSNYDVSYSGDCSVSSGGDDNENNDENNWFSHLFSLFPLLDQWFQHHHSGEFSFGGDHDQTKTCTITNTYVAPKACTFVSDETTMVGSSPAVVTAPTVSISGPWTTGLPDAKWIWNAALATPSDTADEVVTFTKTFNLSNVPTSVKLDMAADNYYTVAVNGTPACGTNGADLDNFTSLEPTCDITSLVTTGVNTLTFVVTNAKGYGTDPQVNPGGLKYKVTIDGASCDDVPPPTPNTLKVHILKYLKNSDGEQAASGDLPAFPMQSSWSATNIGSGSGSYSLNSAGFGGAGAYAADTSAMSTGANYSTSEVPNGTTVLGSDAQCTPGAYRLVGYQTGDSLAGALGTTPTLTTPNFTGLTADKYVVVVNEKCPDAPAPSCNADTELLTNGNFEAPAVSAGGWNLFPSGTAGLGWAVNWLNNDPGQPAVANLEIQHGLSGWAASLGGLTQWAELDSDWATNNTGHSAATTISQDIATIPGDTYTFSYDFSPRPGTATAENKVEARADGVVIGTSGPTDGSALSNTQWVSQSFSFVATSTTTHVELRDAGTPSDSFGGLVDNASVRCTPTKPVEHIHVVASKVVCTDEKDLPNWGQSGHGPITATTAANWVASHESCHLEDGWSFQWGNSSTADGGNTTVGEVAGYTTFGPTVNGTVSTDIPMSSAGNEVHLREVLKDGYIPFTYNNDPKNPNGDNVSAEFYCADDALNYDNFDFIRNPVAGANYYCVAFNSPKQGGEGGDTHTDETIVVKAADLAGSFADVISDASKWFFYNDNNDTIDNTLGSFVTGPTGQPLGTGSAEITDGAAGVADRTDIATYQFASTSLASITSLKFSAYSHSGVAGANESPYLVFNVSLNGADTWQKRLVYVPSANGAVAQDTWNTFDTINGGAGKWTWSGYAGNGNKWPDGNTNEYRTWSDILASFPHASVRKTDSFMGVRVGEPGPTNYTGNIDAFVVGVKTGSNTDTKTFDFEPTAKKTDGGGGGPPQTFSFTTTYGGGSAPQGQVEGASTSTPQTCSPLITDFLKLGWKNSPDQVKKLQTFLNGNLGLHLPVTGFFGPQTFKAVKLYQKGSWSDVLKPWFTIPGSGIQTENDPTGFVYLTTKWHINNDYCPGSEAFPSELK